MLAVPLLAFAIPTAASAATTQGTVLLVNAHQRSIQLIESGDAVHGIRYSRRFPAVTFGTRLSYRAVAGRVRAVRVLGHRVSRVSFYAVLESIGAHGISLRVGDGTRLRFDRSALGAASKQFSAGQSVLVTETRKHGRVRLSLRPRARAAGSGPGNGETPPPVGPVGGSESVTSGVVTEIGSDSIAIRLPDGSSISPTLPAASLAYLNTAVDIEVCETVTIAYHTSSAGPVLDSLAPTGFSTAPIPESLGDTCAEESDGGIDVVGSITAIGPTSVTVAVPGQGAMTFAVDPTQDLLDGNLVGDVVDVTYTQNADGSLSADDVEYAEEYTTGTITAVNSNLLTINDAVTGDADAFDPGAATFDGISIGQAVGVDFYVAGGQPQADDVSAS